MSIDRQLDKEGVLHIYHEYYSAIRKGDTTIHNNMERACECYAKLKKKVRES